ncbi:MAG: phosphomannomutase/phosphoglucomutase [Synergistaceae bacterium]|nr:phosphomannomutase/phosphoglucomutase [Synergistaceae bacterium]
MAKIPAHIFREYDIRGLAEEELTSENVELIALAYGTWLVRSGVTKAALGGDVRLSTSRIKAALAKGLLAAGVDVVDLGVTSTPTFYWSFFRCDADGGIQVTGSHNPKEFNGLKVAFKKATLWGDAIQNIYRMIEADDFAVAKIPGKFSSLDITDEYINMLASKVQLGNRKLKIVCDYGNGAGGCYGPKLFRKLGCEVVDLFAEPDGNFPNHHPDPTKRGNLLSLMEAVTREGADAGFGYDGDADRLGVVDDKGNMLVGDRLMALYWREILAKNPGAVAICEVKSSMALPEDVEKHGGKPLWWCAGHSLIKAKMAEQNALFSGEVSGHLFFADEYFGYDDAFYAAERLCRILSNSDRKLSDIMEEIPQYPATAETRYDCPDDKKRGVVDKFKEQALAENLNVITVDGARIIYKNGWGLVRISNTQPVLVARCEGRTKEALADICADMKRRLLNAGSPAFEWEF